MTRAYEPWWVTDEAHRHEAVAQTVKFLREHNNWRREMNLRHMRLYGNLDIPGYGPTDYYKSASSQSDKLSLNIIKSVCDAVTAKIAKNRPRPTFLTSGGDYSLQRKAKLLDKFVEGQFYATKIYQVAPRVFLDGCVFDVGALKIFCEGGKICIERVFPGELEVDHSEAVYGCPRQLYQIKYIDRAVLEQLYPKKLAEIRICNDAGNAEGVGRDTMADQLCVYESWYLPSGDGAGDGRHIIAIDNATLLEEPWTEPTFPFVFIRWSPRLLGFWGMGLAEELTGIQVEINRLLRKIQQSFHLMGVPRVYLEHGSKVVKAHLNNEIGSIVTYTGAPPVISAPQTVHPEVFAHLDRLYNRAFEIAGISQLTAQSKKPAGLESGAALREYNDIESERFIIVARDYEEFFMEAARMMVRLARKMPGYKVLTPYKRGPSRGQVLEIKWSEIKLDEDQYIMQVFPTSALPHTPAGRTATIEQWIQAGFVEKDDGKRLLDFPDLEQVVSLDVAASEDLDRVLELMIDHGKYEAPEPFQNLQMAVPKVQSAYLRAKLDGVPEDRLELLRQFMADCTALLQQAGALGPPPGAPPPEPEGAPPSPAAPAPPPPA